MDLVTTNQATATTLDAAVAREMEQWQIPGIAVGVYRDGAITTAGYGTGNIETGLPVTAETVFQIGSITKVFLTTLLMQLVEAGKADLDSPVITYLPELQLADPEAQATITLRHLVTHTSGLEGDWFPDFGPGDDALTRLLSELHTLEQITPPGGPWSYCNSGFYLAGAIIERLTGQTFEAAMRERIFAPLGMDHTTFFAHEAILWSASAGHLQEPGDPAPAVARPYPLARCANPAGGIITNVADLFRFAAFHLGDGTVHGKRLLTSASLTAMRTPQVRVHSASEWGLGWGISRNHDVMLISHNGGTNGFITQFTVIPERRAAFAILTNSSRGGAAIRGISRWILAHEFALPYEPPRPVRLDPEQLAPLAGHYRQPMAKLTFSVVEPGLQLDAVDRNPFTQEDHPQPPVILTPISETAFLAMEGEFESMRVDFLPGPDDRPAYVRVGSRLSQRADA